MGHPDSHVQNATQLLVYVQCHVIIIILYICHCVRKVGKRLCSLGHQETSTSVFVAVFCNSLKLEVSHIPVNGGTDRSWCVHAANNTKL